jgi:hypothetical protein
MDPLQLANPDIEPSWARLAVPNLGAARCVAIRFPAITISMPQVNRVVFISTVDDQI